MRQSICTDRLLWAVRSAISQQTAGLLVFFRHAFSRGPSADRRETWPHDRKLSEFYNRSPKIRRPSPPKKNLRPKHAKFRSILYNLRRWSRISPERLKISKIGKLIFPHRFFLPSLKMVRWTLAHKLQRSWSEFGPIKMHFLRYYISAIRGRCALKFLHAQVLGKSFVKISQLPKPC